MKKFTQIHYNPYTSEIVFKLKLSPENDWVDYPSESELCKYFDIKVLFSNCKDNIVSIINKEQNTTPEGLEIQFIGPKVDYELLEKAIEKLSPNSSGGKLSCKLIKLYKSADESLQLIKSSYDAISDEFSDYLPGNPKYEGKGIDIGDSISKFNQITSKEIPICVIGTYSVGKSALINSFIGDEILPSKEDPSTAKNVRVVKTNQEYWIEFDYENQGSDKTRMKFFAEDFSLKLANANGPEQDVAQEMYRASTATFQASHNSLIVYAEDFLPFSPLTYTHSELIFSGLNLYHTYVVGHIPYEVSVQLDQEFPLY